MSSDPSLHNLDLIVRSKAEAIEELTNLVVKLIKKKKTLLKDRKIIPKNTRNGNIIYKNCIFT